MGAIAFSLCHLPYARNFLLFAFAYVLLAELYQLVLYLLFQLQ